MPRPTVFGGRGADLTFCGKGWIMCLPDQRPCGRWASEEMQVQSRRRGPLYAGARVVDGDRVTWRVARRAAMAVHPSSWCPVDSEGRDS